VKITYELSNIKDAAARFWKAMNDKKVIAFHGNMGAGKTTFIHALCEVKGSERCYRQSHLFYYQ
jgi:tRNA threonylcarbamoyladenosine biosynthesis protein TsaE